MLVVAVLLATGGFDPAKITQRYGSEYDQFYQTAEDAFSQTRYRRSAGNGNAKFIFLNYIFMSFKTQLKSIVVCIVGFCFGMMIYNWIDRVELYFLINSSKHRVCKKHD